jgi:hypothetical protein
MEEFDVKDGRLPCVSRKCNELYSVIQIEDELIAAPIIRLFQKGYNPVLWSSGIRGLPYVYVAFALGESMLSRSDVKLPSDFRLADGFLDFENERDMLRDGVCEILHAKIPKYQSEEERVAHIIRLVGSLMVWAEEVESYHELCPYDSEAEEEAAVY